MKTIWKYNLNVTDRQVVDMPLSSNGILSVGCDPQGKLAVWAVVDPETKPLRPCTFFVVGTDNPVPDDIANYDFLGTVVMPPFAWHVYVLDD